MSVKSFPLAWRLDPLVWDLEGVVLGSSDLIIVIVYGGGWSCRLKSVRFWLDVQGVTASSVSSACWPTVDCHSTAATDLKQVHTTNDTLIKKQTRVTLSSTHWKEMFLVNLTTTQPFLVYPAPSSNSKRLGRAPGFWKLHGILMERTVFLF